MSEAATRDRFRGCLLGLAAGDALGTTLEFKRPGSFEPSWPASRTARKPTMTASVICAPEPS